MTVSICVLFHVFYSQKANKSALPLVNAPDAMKAITGAIEEYHNKTCIIFKKRTEKKERAYIEFFYGFGWVCYWDEEAYSEQCDTSKMDLFSKNTFFCKTFHLKCLLRFWIGLWEMRLAGCVQCQKNIDGTL